MLLEQPLGQLATRIAGATAVFHQFKLDFCCGGQQSLGAAIAKRGLNQQEVLAALEKLQRQPQPAVDWHSEPTAKLAEYVLNRFHQRHREQLPELIRLARRVETVHSDSPHCPHGLANHLAEMQQELESHMLKEEQILFPMLVRGVYPYGPISVMLEEHQEHGEALRKLDELSFGQQLHPGACNTWTALYLGLRELKEDLMQHILLENEILFVEPKRPGHGDQHCCGSCQ
ncbi:MULTISPECIES: iron-sulfur cluster repair protein YtfE [Alishewanella]|uniref:Iron-sulfur cluster repair di-iron protein n=2 Tax=Alishewanella TaxID=111142 RepID=H3ZFT9_9ALTE|nr:MULTISPECIES: iron-sulfur cluster repair protein YtfE [Alishewanella]EHR40573.1 iron-sulfur cluster repair di-iron protein [Alishewanella jeotgali KCTC 22429]EJI84812.1 iron-sulfur cluster repair di-iron protein [Alishewanella aestuarii B11]MCT8124989.1 iron-sulfur cluster repair protein YtfE [Alishewanella sp. BS5-314]